MKFFAFLLALAAVGGSVYTYLEPFTEYQEVRSEWSSMNVSNPNYQAVSDRRSELREQCQIFIIGSGALAFLGFIFGIVAQRKKGGFLPILGILLSLGVDGLLAYMLIEGNVF